MADYKFESVGELELETIDSILLDVGQGKDIRYIDEDSMNEFKDQIKYQKNKVKELTNKLKGISDKDQHEKAEGDLKISSAYLDELESKFKEYELDYFYYKPFDGEIFTDENLPDLYVMVEGEPKPYKREGSLIGLKDNLGGVLYVSEDGKQYSYAFIDSDGKVLINKPQLKSTDHEIYYKELKLEYRVAKGDESIKVTVPLLPVIYAIHRDDKKGLAILDRSSKGKVLPNSKSIFLNEGNFNVELNIKADNLFVQEDSETYVKAVYKRAVRKQLEDAEKNVDEIRSALETRFPDLLDIAEKPTRLKFTDVQIFSENSRVNLTERVSDATRSRILNTKLAVARNHVNSYSKEIREHLIKNIPMAVNLESASSLDTAYIVVTYNIESIQGIKAGEKGNIEKLLQSMSTSNERQMLDIMILNDAKAKIKLTDFDKVRPTYKKSTKIVNKELISNLGSASEEVKSEVERLKALDENKDLTTKELIKIAVNNLSKDEAGDLKQSIINDISNDILDNLPVQVKGAKRLAAKKNIKDKLEDELSQYFNESEGTLTVKPEVKDDYKDLIPGLNDPDNEDSMNDLINRIKGEIKESVSSEVVTDRSGTENIDLGEKRRNSQANIVEREVDFDEDKFKRATSKSSMLVESVKDVILSTVKNPETISILDIYEDMIEVEKAKKVVHTDKAIGKEDWDSMDEDAKRSKVKDYLDNPMEEKFEAKIVRRYKNYDKFDSEVENLQNAKCITDSDGHKLCMISTEKGTQAYRLMSDDVDYGYRESRAGNLRSGNKLYLEPRLESVMVNGVNYGIATRVKAKYKLSRDIAGAKSGDIDLGKLSYFLFKGNQVAIDPITGKELKLTLKDLKSNAKNSPVVVFKKPYGDILNPDNLVLVSKDFYEGYKDYVQELAPDLAAKKLEGVESDLPKIEEVSARIELIKVLTPGNEVINLKIPTEDGWTVNVSPTDKSEQIRVKVKNELIKRIRENGFKGIERLEGKFSNPIRNIKPKNLIDFKLRFSSVFVWDELEGDYTMKFYEDGMAPRTYPLSGSGHKSILQEERDVRVGKFNAEYGSSKINFNKISNENIGDLLLIEEDKDAIVNIFKEAINKKSSTLLSYYTSRKRDLTMSGKDDEARALPENEDEVFNTVFLSFLTAIKGNKISHQVLKKLYATISNALSEDVSKDDLAKFIQSSDLFTKPTNYVANVLIDNLTFVFNIDPSSLEESDDENSEEESVDLTHEDEEEYEDEELEVSEDDDSEEDPQN